MAYTGRAWLDSLLQDNGKSCRAHRFRELLEPLNPYALPFLYGKGQTSFQEIRPSVLHTHLDTRRGVGSIYARSPNIGLKDYERRSHIRQRSRIQDRLHRFFDRNLNLSIPDP